MDSRPKAVQDIPNPKPTHNAESENLEPEIHNKRFDLTYDPKALVQEKRANARWHKTRQAILPEPLPFEEVDYGQKESIRKMFKDHGLQVIVKMASIELTPEKPEFPAGGWHVSDPAR